MNKLYDINLHTVFAKEAIVTLQRIDQVVHPNCLPIQETPFNNQNKEKDKGN